MDLTSFQQSIRTITLEKPCELRQRNGRKTEHLIFFCSAGSDNCSLQKLIKSAITSAGCINSIYRSGNRGAEMLPCKPTFSMARCITSSETIS